jgi:hypothetical protein
MYSSLCVAIILLLIESVVGVYVDDNRIIIGSSVGGVLGLVSLIFQDEAKHFRMNSRSSWFLILLLSLNYFDQVVLVYVRKFFGFYLSSFFQLAVCFSK